MTDTEILDWIEANHPKISYMPKNTWMSDGSRVTVKFLDKNQYTKDISGFSLRSIIQRIADEPF